MYHYHSTEVSGAAAGSASWTSLFKHQPDVLSSCRKKCYLSEIYIFSTKTVNPDFCFLSSFQGLDLVFWRPSKPAPASTAQNLAPTFGASQCWDVLWRLTPGNMQIGGLHCPKSIQLFNEDCFISSLAYRERSITPCLGDFSMKAKVNLQVGRSHSIPLQCRKFLAERQENCLKP